MTRYILLALLLVVCDYATDKLVDRRLKDETHERHGYSTAEVRGMQRLTARAVETASNRHPVLTAVERDAAIRYLWGERNDLPHPRQSIRHDPVRPAGRLDSRTDLYAPMRYDVQTERGLLPDVAEDQLKAA